MADPLSTASSAIGVISLSLQIAQQLITFCQAYQSYDEDAKRIKSKAESLRLSLRMLRELIEDAQVSNPDLAEDLSEKALGMQRMVNRLRKRFERHLPAIADGFPEKIRGQIKRIVYPFRRDEVKEMFEDLDGIQNALQTTLSIHSMQKMNKVELMQDAILEEVQQIRITLQEYPEGMPPPALLKSWCDSHYDLDQTSVTEAQIATITSRSEIAIRSTSNLTSHAISPYKRTSSNQGETTAKSYKFLSTLLRVAVTASFSLSKGAGGFSIAPSLSVQTVLNYNGSILKLQFHQFFNHKKSTISEFDQTVDNCIRQVQLAFSAGQSKPSDIFYLDDAPRDYNMISYVDGLVPFDIATTPDQLPGLHKLTRFLVDNGSRPINTFSQGALRGLLRFTRFRDEDYALASYLVDHGGPCTLDNGTLNHIERYNIKYILARNKEILIVPEVARILFQESEEELKIGLEYGHIGADDKACGCSLLQLAFGWPRGMQLLIEAGATVGGGSLISFWGCPSPLLEEDIGFNRFFHSTRLLLDAGCGLSIPVLQTPRSGKLLSLFVSVLAERRRKLGKLAQSCLPREELQALGVYADKVPDLHASKICEKLAARGKINDQSLLVRNQKDSIYHNRDLIPRVMDELYKAGFKDFDSPSSTKATPLMTTYESFHSAWEAIERMVWFLSKGADISRTLPYSSARTAHLLTVQIIGFLIAILEIKEPHTAHFQWSRLEEKITQSKEFLFPCPSITDKCTCPCSPQGCSIVSVAVRQAMHWSRWSGITDNSSWLKRLIKCIIKWTQSTLSVEQAVIRCLTFDALGLKHTCCIEIDGVVRTSDRRDADQMVGRDQEEIFEIQAENMQGLEIFDRLVAEFEAKFTEFGLPINEFLECYWHPHMVKHLLERDPYSEEHDRETRNMGIILQAEEEDLNQVSLLLRHQIEEIDKDDE